MRNVDHALEVLKDLIGLESLAMRDDIVTLRFDGLIDVSIVRISETEIELSADLEDIGPNPAPERLVALLTANYHGHGTGFGRVALDPRDGKVVFCGRLDVSSLEARELEQAVLAYLKYALYWDGPGTDDVLAARPVAAPVVEPDAASEEFTFLRL